MSLITIAENTMDIMLVVVSVAIVILLFAAIVVVIKDAWSDESRS